MRCALILEYKLYISPDSKHCYLFPNVSCVTHRASDAIAYHFNKILILAMNTSRLISFCYSFHKLFEAQLRDNYYLRKHSSRYFCKSTKLITEDGKYRISAIVPKNNTAKYGIFVAVSLSGIFSIFQSNSEETVEEQIDRGKKYIEEGNAEKAHATLNNALKQALDSHQSEEVISIQEYLAYLALQQKQYDQAIYLLLNVRMYMENHAKPFDDLEYNYVLLSLGDAYQNSGNYKKAQEIYRVCYKNTKSKMKAALQNKNLQTLILSARILVANGHNQLSVNNLDKAFKYFRKAYEVSAKAHGEISEASVLLLKDMGNIFLHKGNLDQSSEYLKRATEIGKRLPGMEELSIVYTSLGRLYLAQGYANEAKYCCEQALKNAKRHKNEEGIKEAEACLASIST